MIFYSQESDLISGMAREASISVLLPFQKDHAKIKMIHKKSKSTGEPQEIVWPKSEHHEKSVNAPVFEKPSQWISRPKLHNQCFKKRKGFDFF